MQIPEKKPTLPPTQPPQSTPEKKKSNKLRQAGIGIILGLLTIFIPLYPIAYSLQTFLTLEAAFLPAIIINTLVTIIVTLIARKKWPVFAYTYLLFSLLSLIFIAYFFQTFSIS